VYRYCQLKSASVTWDGGVVEKSCFKRKREGMLAEYKDALRIERHERH